MNKRMKIALCCLLALLGVRAAAQSSTSETSSTLKVWIDDFTLTADGETVGYLHISENDIIDYTAFQMRINVPAGLTIQKVKVGRNTYDAMPTDRFSATHTATCNLVDDGKTIKIGVLSLANELFFPDDEAGNPLDELCAIALTADHSMINGDYDITMDDIKFIIPNSYAYIPESTASAKLTIIGGQEGSVGIQQTEKESNTTTYYDLSGRAVKNLSRGIYVNEHKKIMVK